MLTLLYRIYQLLVLLPVTVIGTALIGLTVTIIAPLGNKQWGQWWGYHCGRLWGKMMVRTTLLPVKVTGRDKLDKSQSYVFVANHQGCYDIFLVFGYINFPISWMLKAELEKIPFLGSACRNSGMIFVDNKSTAKVRQTYIRAEKVLQGGMSLMVFPEGARSFTGKMDKFKRGAFLLADELQLPIVPMTINGPFEVMPRQRDFHFAHWHRLSLTIHDPIFPIGKGAENIENMMIKSKQAIESALIQ